MNLKDVFKHLSTKTGNVCVSGSIHFRDDAQWKEFKETFKDNVVEWYISGENDPRDRRIYEVYKFRIGNAELGAFGPDRPNPAYNPATTLVECPKCGNQFVESELKRYVSPKEVMRSGPLKSEQKQEEKQQ